MYSPYSQKNVQECRCGAPTCRGVLGPKSKDLSKSKDKEPKSTQLTVKDAGPKRKANKILDESTSQLNKKQRVSKSATLILGARKSGSKVRTTLQSVRSQVKVTAPEKTTKRRVMVKPTQVKKRGSAVGRVRIPSRNSSNSTPGRKKQVRVSNGRLNMPSKPRLGNSIAAARASIKTPAAMRKFLQLGSTATDTINSTTLLGTRTRRGKAYSAGDCVKAGNGAGEEPPVRRPRGRPKKNP